MQELHQHTKEEKRGEEGHHSCIGQPATGVNKEMEMMGLVGAVWEEGFPCRPLLLRKNVLS